MAPKMLLTVLLVIGLSPVSTCIKSNNKLRGAISAISGKSSTPCEQKKKNMVDLLVRKPNIFFKSGEKECKVRRFLAKMFVDISTTNSTNEVAKTTKVTKAQFVNYEQAHDLQTIQSVQRVFGELDELTFSEFEERVLHDDILLDTFIDKILAQEGLERSDYFKIWQNLVDPTIKDLVDRRNKHPSKQRTDKEYEKEDRVLSWSSKLFVGVLTGSFSNNVPLPSSSHLDEVARIKVSKTQFKKYEEDHNFPGSSRIAEKLFREQQQLNFSQFAERFLNVEELRRKGPRLSIPLTQVLLFKEHTC